MRPLPVLALLTAVLICGLCIQTVLAESADEWVNSGNQLQQQRQYQEALLAFENATRLDPVNKYAWTGKSVALNDLGRAQESLSAAETALTLDQNFGQAWKAKGHALQNLNRNPEALEAFNKALEIDSNDGGSWSGKSNVLIRLYKPDEALVAAEKALAIDPANSHFWNSKGYALEGLGRHPEALEAFNKALSIDSNNQWSWSGKSNILNQMGRSDEALSAAEKALSIDSGRAGIWNSKGYALLSLGRYQESLDAFNAGLARDANNQNSQSGRQEALNYLGTRAPTAAADTMFRSNPEHTGVFDNSGIEPDNTELWRFATKGVVDSSPAVSNGVVYAGSDDKNLYAIDAVTGKEKWRFATGGPVWSSPAVSDGVAYVGSHDKNLYAIDAVTGKEKWRFATGGAVRSSPAVTNGVVYVGSDDNNLYAIDAVTGKEKWRFATGGVVDSSPAVTNGVVYAGSDDNNLYAIDAVTGKEKWRFRTGGSVHSSPAVTNGVVYVGSAVYVGSQGNNLYAIDAVNGTEKWRFATGGVVESSPAVSNGVAYVGSHDKNLYAIDAVTGTEKWHFATGSIVVSSPGVSNGIVYVGSRDNNLYAIDAANGTEKWRFATGGPVWSSPAVSDGVVYIGSFNNNLYAVGQKSSTPIEGKNDGTPLPGLTLIIAGIILVFCIAGGGYYFLHSRKSAPHLPPDRGIPAPAPDRTVPAPVPEKGIILTEDPTAPLSDPRQHDEASGRLSSARTAIDQLTLWKSAVKPTIERAGKCFATGDYIRASSLAQNAEHSARELARWEDKVNYWKQMGYAITPLENIGSLSVDSIITECRKFEEEVQSLEIKALEKLKKQVDGVKQAVPIPVSIMDAIESKDPQTIRTAQAELETLISTAKPQLSLMLGTETIQALEWNRVAVTIKNNGSAHARNISLNFSDDVEIRRFKPVDIPAGSELTVEVWLRSNLKGKIPLDITARCTSALDTQEFTWTNELLLTVIPEGTGESPAPRKLSGDRIQTPSTPKTLPPDLSDRYTEVSYLGKGGFARVYKAKRRDGTPVAVKVPISIDAATGKSFIAELQNWTKINHENIVRVYDFNIMPIPYFEMELCDSSLADRKKPIGSEEAAWILFHVCEGLKFTHSNKIIHRDLKPQNILLKNGVPKISDWGLSRVITESTSTTAASFTPYYASPEQIGNKAKDERTDIWQLGVIFYELVTGELPFTGDSMVAVMAAITSKIPQLPSVINPASQDVEALIMKCLEKNPAKRYQSVLELQKDLALYLRVTYTESLKLSVTANDPRRSASYCGDLVMVNLLTGDMKSANKYLTDLVNYAEGDVKILARELSEQIRMRMEMGVTEIPDELIEKAEIIVHKVSVGFRKVG